MTTHGYIESGAMVALMSYLSIAWNQHKAATLNIPERRTFYDFFHCHPYAFWALYMMFGLSIDLLNNYGF